MTARILTSDAPGREKQTLYPIAIFVCICLVGLLFSVFLSRNSANQQQLLAETVAVRSALDAQLHALGARTENLADGLPVQIASARAGAVPLPSASDIAYFIEPARGLPTPAGELGAIFSRLAPVLAAMASADNLRGAIADREGAAKWSHAQTLTAVAGSDAWLVAVVPEASAERSGARAVLGLRRLDGRMLADLARTAHTQRIELASHASVEPGLGVVQLDPSGSELALVWAPERPGQDIVDHNAFFLIAFAAIFAALIVFYSQRVTREAVAGEAAARASAGQDPLTGLPNKLLFAKLLEGEAERVRRSLNDRGAAVLLLDVDRLGEVNAASGEEFGDRVIAGLAQRLAGLVRSSGRIGRIGGDEFAILQTDVVGPRDAEMLARRIVEALSEPVEVDDSKVYVSVSIGIALCPLDADNADELLRRADLALYRAKNAGRNTWSFFEEKTGQQLTLQKAVEDDLREAIERDELQLLYQPVMEASGKRMVGVEALVRWPHPAHGFISPQNFIALAEECGLIQPLGEWVLRRALADVRNWPGLKVAVNVSGVQLRDPKFVDMLEQLLRHYDVDAARLELEVTENILLADADAAEEAMISVRAMGVRLALDDFGTGYSSLIYLRRFAFDKIKIDKSFLDSMEATGESAIIVHSIVHLGRALGLTVTAEGVETTEQLRFLQALACHELQGYLFSKPVPADAITEMLARQNGAQTQRAVA